MSMSPVAPPAPTGSPQRRVRHQAREAIAVMVFSFAMSVAFALLLLALGALGSRG